MDVTEILASDPGLGLSRVTIIFIAVTVAGIVMAVGGKVLEIRKPGLANVATWLMIPGMVLFAVGCCGGVVSSYTDELDRGAMFESALFEGYGFTVERPRPLWHSVESAGDAGTVTKLRREGVEQDVRIQLDGTRLIITGPDGREIPANR